MVYIFFGNIQSIINDEVKKIIKKENIDTYNISNFDLNYDKIEDIIDEANTISMFSEKRVIIVDNAFIFCAKKNDIEQNLEMLEEYLKNINENTILIFKLNSEKLDVRRKIVKLAKEKCVIKEFNKISINNLVTSELKDYKINNDTLSLFINKVGSDYNFVLNELNKIKMYTYDKKEITSDDVMAITTKNIESDIFAFVDYIVLKDKDRAFKKYDELIKMGEEPIKIIALLANQFKLLYFVKELTLMGYSESLIASKLQVHPYRVKLAREKQNAYTSEKFEEILINLAKLDLDIKKGNIDRFIGLEKFLLEV